MNEWMKERKKERKREREKDRKTERQTTKKQREKDGKKVGHVTSYICVSLHKNMKRTFWLNEWTKIMIEWMNIMNEKVKKWMNVTDWLNERKWMWEGMRRNKNQEQCQNWLFCLSSSLKRLICILWFSLSLTYRHTDYVFFIFFYPFIVNI